MQNKHKMFLLYFSVKAQDRRNGDVLEGSPIVMPYMGKCPDDIEDVEKDIRRIYDVMGYNVLETEYDETRVKEIDLIDEFLGAQPYKDN